MAGAEVVSELVIGVETVLAFEAVFVLVADVEAVFVLVAGVETVLASEADVEIAFEFEIDVESGLVLDVGVGFVAEVEERLCLLAFLRVFGKLVECFELFVSDGRVWFEHEVLLEELGL